MGNYDNLLEIALRGLRTYQGIEDCITSRADFLVALVYEGFSDNLLNARLQCYEPFLIEAWKRGDIDFVKKGNKQIPYLIKKNIKG
jgi:hypothetical protein